MVFFTGTLQDGITTALQSSKLVVCFVTDDQEESKTWESEYLTDETIAASLEKDAVLLRLEAGSQEAGYLAAIFPLPKSPTLVIIKDGKLKEYLSTGTSKEEFVSKVEKAFATQTDSNVQASASAAPVTQSQTPTPTPSASEAPATASPAQPSPSPSSATLAPAAQSQGPTQSRILAEAERRRQEARKEREEAERERRRQEKGKMPATKDDIVKQKASQQLAERQRKAREEKARVLKLIEDDKAERRARTERARAERQGVGEAGAAVATEAEEAAQAPSSAVGRRHDQCALQVRLFDGATIRTRFPAKAVVAREVRAWIDEKRTDGAEPYTLKVILTPMPNKAIDQATEEEQTLEELGLVPSATLVLTPVDRYSSAYTSMNAGLTNPVSRLFTAVLAVVVNLLGGIATALGGMGERGRAEPEEGAQAGTGQGDSQGQATASGRDASGRVRGFQNPDDAKKDHQLYNGNSLNFEPRKDDEDKDK